MRRLIRTISSSINQSVGYPSIKHLTLITEKDTKGMALNFPAKEPLTWEDQEELNFFNVHIFLRHVKAAQREVYNSIMRFWKHFVLVNKQNQKLKTRFTNYEKTNEAYVINNTQLKAKNNNLEN